MRFIPPLVVAALVAAAQQPVDEAKLASARAAHADTQTLNDAIDALETRQRARAHERRRLEQRKNEGAAHAAAISNKTEALWAELTKTKDLGDGRGPCDLASAGPDALTWARDALKDAAAASKRLQGDRKAYLEAAQADLELLNRTVYPSLRAERDAIDLNLNDARARQKVLREDHAKSKTAWLRDQAKSFPLSLARSGAANWTAFRGAFNACAPILYGCRCHDDYDLFLSASCREKTPSPPLRHRRESHAGAAPRTWRSRAGSGASAPRTRARALRPGRPTRGTEARPWRSPSRTRTSTSSSGGSTRSTSTATGARRATRIVKRPRSRSGTSWSCGRASGRRRCLCGW